MTPTSTSNGVRDGPVAFPSPKAAIKDAQHLTGQRQPLVASESYTEKLGGVEETPKAVTLKDVDASNTAHHVMNLLSLEKRAIIITGSARGLGLCLASACIEAGADVYCCDILPQPAEPEYSEVRGLAKAKGNKHLSYHQLDICDAVAARSLFASIAAERAEAGKSPITGLVHAAAIQHSQPAMDYDMSVFEKIMKVNVEGSFAVAQAAGRIMKDNGGVGGSIVLVASMSGVICNRGLTCSAYNTSKAAVHQMSRSLAVEFAAHGIRVNTLSPGYIHTAMTNQLLEREPHLLAQWVNDNPQHRIATPFEFKAPTVFLLSQGASFVTGADLRVDGGHCAW
ncbi:unnamed protein product [Parajaminaea phylloscopi]